MISSVTKFNLKPYNTFGMDVMCNRWIEYTSSEDLPQISDMVFGNRYLFIGGGSNLLFLGDYDGDVLHSRILDLSMSIDGDGDLVVRAGAGVVMDELIEQCAVNGIWGMENLSGIPGEVGASAVQNGGAFGVEAKDFIREVECYDMLTLSFVKFDVRDCKYGYRSSLFKEKQNKGRYVVTYVTFVLNQNRGPVLDYGNLQSAVAGCELTPRNVRDAVLAMRASKLPSVTEIGSAGSFFKNPVVSIEEFERVKQLASDTADGVCTVPHYPVGNDSVKIPAAWLIDQCGLKGYHTGNVAVWHLQPLVIVNATGKASPNEITGMECHVIECVKNKFGIELHPEVEHI